MALRTDVPLSTAIHGMGLELVFFGNEKLATGIQSDAPLLKSLIDYGHHIEALVLRTKRIDEKQPIVKFAREHNINIFAVTSKAELSSVCNKFNSQIAVLAAFGAIVPQEVLDMFPLGIINIHPSLLPQYRGSTPIEHALLDNLKETGVSLMKLELELDAGPLYWQQPVAIAEDDTKQTLYEKLTEAAAAELPGLLSSIVGGSAKPFEQIGEPSFTKTLSKEDGRIEWTQSAQDIANHVRAFYGWPGSNATIGEHEVMLMSTAVNSEHTLKPGEWYATKKQLFIGCSKGVLEIIAVKPQGKKIISGADFSRGYLK